MLRDELTEGEGDQQLADTDEDKASDHRRACCRHGEREHCIYADQGDWLANPSEKLALGLLSRATSASRPSSLICRASASKGVVAPSCACSGFLKSVIEVSLLVPLDSAKHTVLTYLWLDCYRPSFQRRERTAMGTDHSILIAPLGATGRADEVAVRISEAIQLGLLTDGERLPPEAEFAQQFGVSPVTLREAIATLRERGLIETRRGRTGGSFVRRAAEPDEKPDVARLRGMSATALRDLADEHLAIATTAATLAAERASEASVKRILQFAQQLEQATSRGDRMKADSRFHIEVAIATRSERLTRREVALQAETIGLLWTSHLPESDVVAQHEEHLAIATAISKEDGEVAGELAHKHVTNNLKRLTAAYLSLTRPTRRQS
ncbi:FadR/GntR family transcriptional regulator [Nocardioides daeguensis]|nr:GntR family transcriptional regulator [Nocardioides daeguensis]